MSTILICQSDAKLQRKMFSFLKKEKFETKLCGNESFEEELEKINEQGLLIIDAKMKWSESRDLLETAACCKIPVVFLTQDLSMTDHLKAMFKYHCEVLREPVSKKLLLKAIHSLLLTEKKDPPEIVMDHKERTAELDGKKVNLTAQEYALLSTLMESPNAPVSREDLLRKAWGYQSMGETRTVDVHVQRLRKKLGNGFIETVYKYGYQLNLACV